MYIVADFAAGPVQYGSAKEGDGAVSPNVPVWSGGYSDMARLVKVVDSALAHVIAPDVYGEDFIRFASRAVSQRPAMSRDAISSATTFSCQWSPLLTMRSHLLE
jgi:hypothetical protein